MKKTKNVAIGENNIKLQIVLNYIISHKYNSGIQLDKIDLERLHAVITVEPKEL
jgi:hypothetical protein